MTSLTHMIADAVSRHEDGRLVVEALTARPDYTTRHVSTRNSYRYRWDGLDVNSTPVYLDRGGDSLSDHVLWLGGVWYRVEDAEAYALRILAACGHAHRNHIAHNYVDRVLELERTIKRLAADIGRAEAVEEES